MSTANISIIVPCWRGDAVPDAVAAGWLRSGVVREIIFAEAAGADGPAADAPPVPGVRHLRCARAGRGTQMNEGARLAMGDILLFNHADTDLTETHLHRLHGAMAADARLGGGAFPLLFAEAHPGLTWLQPWETLRCRRFGPMFGDQSIFVRREVFEQLGGYADIPLMEDVEFSLRLRRRARIAILDPAIYTSPRKHLREGRWRTTGANALFLLLYALGVSPARLHQWYYRRK